MSQIYAQHDYLLFSTLVLDYEKEDIENILRKKKTDSATIENALQRLSFYLFKHHGVKPWLLIDEYDTPIQTAYLNNYYKEMMEVM